MPKSPHFLLSLVCFLFFSPPPLLHRIKLKKGKSIREKMREAGVLEEYLKKIKHDPVKKYNFSKNNVVYEPMASHLDVSSLTAPPAPLLLSEQSVCSEPPRVEQTFFKLLCQSLAKLSPSCLKSCGFLYGTQYLVALHLGVDRSAPFPSYHCKSEGIPSIAARCRDVAHSEEVEVSPIPWT